MALNKWLKKEQIYDDFLEQTLRDHGIENPEEDFKGLKEPQFDEIVRAVKVQRTKDLKDSEARARLEKKLSKLEKYWRAQSGIQKSSQTGSTKSPKGDGTSASKAAESEALKKGQALKKFMQSEGFWEKELFIELVQRGITGEDDWYPNINNEDTFQDIVREVKVRRAGDLKDQASRSRLEKTLAKFEKIWRAKSGIKKTNITKSMESSAKKKNDPQASKQREADALQKGSGLKKYMQKEQFWEKELFIELVECGVTSEEELGTVLNTQKKFDEVIRTVKVARFKELKDQAARSRVEKVLAKFEKIWRGKTGIKKTSQKKGSGGAASKKDNKEQASKQQESEALKNAGELKKYLQKEGIFDTELLIVLSDNGINCEEDIAKIETVKQFDEIIRTVKVQRAKDLKDQTSKNRLEKKLTAFEKIWRAKTGIKKSSVKKSGGGKAKKEAAPKDKKIAQMQSEGKELKQYLQSNSVWEMELYRVLLASGVRDEAGLAGLDQGQLDEIIRKTRVQRFTELKDQGARNRLDKKLVAFEKVWKGLQK